MKRDNRGVTLVEVIVTTVLLGIVIFPTLNTFSLSRYTNLTSKKYIKAEQLSTSTLENIYNISYNNIVDTYNYRLEPKYNELNDIINNKLDKNNWEINKVNDNEYILSREENIKYEDYKISLDIKEHNYNGINNYEYPIIENLYTDNTCIINPTGNTIDFKIEDGKYIQHMDSIKYYEYNTSNSYDNRVVSFYESANISYIKKKWQRACEKIDKFNLEHEKEGIKLEYPVLGEDEYQFASVDEIKSLISKETTIEVYKGKTFTFVNSSITYELNQLDNNGNWHAIIEDEENKEAVNKNRSVTYALLSNSKYTELNNIYYMVVPLSDSWKSDTVTLKNGRDMGSVIKFNMFIDMQPFDSDNNESNKLPEIKFTSASANKDIHLYTNDSNIGYSNPTIANTVNNIDNILTKHEDKNAKAYDIELQITNKNGSTVYIRRKSNNIKF